MTRWRGHPGRRQARHHRRHRPLGRPSRLRKKKTTHTSSGSRDTKVSFAIRQRIERTSSKPLTDLLKAFIKRPFKGLGSRQSKIMR